MITAKKTRKRSGFLPAYLPSNFLKFETLVFDFADKFSKDYSGGMWVFMETSNGSFYMHPDIEEKMHVVIESNRTNQYMTPEAFGIVVTLYALNLLLCRGDEDAYKAFMKLKKYAYAHNESDAIWRAID